MRTTNKLIKSIFLISTLFGFIFAALPNTIIPNTANMTYTIGHIGKQTSSNQVDLNTTIHRTPSKLILYKYESSSPTINIPNVTYSDDASISGNFANMNLPKDILGNDINLPSAVPLLENYVFSKSDTIYIKLIDHDQNTDITTRQTVYLEIVSYLPNTPNNSIHQSILGTQNEKEYIQLRETAPNSGEFTGYINTNTTTSIDGDGFLFVEKDMNIEMTYTDVLDQVKTSISIAIIEPYSYVFFSGNGAKVPSITVDLYKNGSVYKTTTTDSFGRYQFLHIPKGNYTLKVTDPLQRYNHPSYKTKSELAIYGFDNVNTSASYATSFNHPVDGALEAYDIPVDEKRASLWISKSSSKNVVSSGDFLEYKLTVTNNGALDLTNIDVVDNLPIGTKYIKNSSKINNTNSNDPNISSNGLDMTYDIPALGINESVTISYLVEIGTTTSNKITNTAQASTSIIKSNIAKITTTMKNNFALKGIILGRVYDKNNPKISIPNAKIYLDNGKYTLTDKDGKYHFEDVVLGTNIVQIDTDSIKQQVVDCRDNTQSAKNSFSRFVDMKRGSIKRVDFCTLEKTDTLIFKLSLTQIKNNIATINIKIDTDIKNFDKTVYFTYPKNSQILSSSVKPSNKYDDMMIYTINKEQNIDITVKLNNSNASFSSLLTYKDSQNKTNKTKKLIITSKNQIDKISPYTIQLSANKNKRKIEQKIELLPAVLKRNITTIYIDGLYKTYAIFDTKLELIQQLKYYTRYFADAFVTTLLQTTNNKKSISKQDTIVIKNIFSKTKIHETNIDDIINTKIPEFTAQDMAKNNIILWPKEGYIPDIKTTRIAVLHSKSSKLKLYLNNKPVDLIHYDTSFLSKQYKNKQITIYKGVDLKDEDNIIIAKVTTSNNQTIKLKRQIHVSSAPIKAQTLKDKSTLVANGTKPIVVAVQLYDKNGYKARAGIKGTFSISSPYILESNQNYRLENPLNITKSKDTYTTSTNGIAYIKIAPSSKTGYLKMVFDFDKPYHVKTWITPAKRKWILVGFIEGSAEYKTIQKHIRTTTKDDKKTKFDIEGSFFAKGIISKDILVTLAYDSRKSDNTLFENNTLDSYYKVYADRSGKNEDVNSKRKLYIKIEKQQFYVLFGDFNTNINENNIITYSRTLNGLNSVYNSKHIDANIFISDTNAQFVKDELRGDGTSGVYYLSNQNIKQNSEKIYIQTRERFHNEIILHTRYLNKFVDYDIDYDNGAIFFKEAIYSKDANLNPIYIVADYEIDTLGKNKYTYGGRVALKANNEKATIGFTHIKEDLDTKEGKLQGIDLEYQISNQIKLQAQIAKTTTTDDGNNSTGNASGINIDYNYPKINANIYYKKQKGNFGLNQQNKSLSNTEKLGLNLENKLTNNININLQAYQDKDYTTNSKNQTSSITTTYDNEKLKTSLGYRYTNTKETNSSSDESYILASIENRFFNNKLKNTFNYELGLNNNDDYKYPSKFIWNLNYTINSYLDLYYTHESTRSSSHKYDQDIFGLRSELYAGTHLTTSILSETTNNENSLYNNIGLTQMLNPTKNLSITLGIDTANTIKAKSNDKDDFTSYSATLHYKNNNYIYSLKSEYKNASKHKTNLGASVYTDGDNDLAVGLGVDYKGTKEKDQENKYELNYKLALAYRPNITDIILLNKSDYVYTKDVLTNTTNAQIINNIHINYLQPKYELSLQYGIKKTIQHVYSQRTDTLNDIIGLDFVYDITPNFDIGLHSSIMHSYSANQIEYLLGLSVGFNIMHNNWISIGYNINGFDNSDFKDGRYRYDGVYLKFRMKFDQQNVSSFLQKYK